MIWNCRICYILRSKHSSRNCRSSRLFARLSESKRVRQLPPPLSAIIPLSSENSWLYLSNFHTFLSETGRLRCGAAAFCFASHPAHIRSQCLQQAADQINSQCTYPSYRTLHEYHQYRPFAAELSLYRTYRRHARCIQQTEH